MTEQEAQGLVVGYVLDEDSTYSLTEILPIVPRWTEYIHTPNRERGLIVLAGETLVTSWFQVPREGILWLRFIKALPEISADGLEVFIHADYPDGTDVHLLQLQLLNEMPAAGTREAKISLPVAEGQTIRIRLHCGPGADGDPTADWLAISGLIVAAECEISRFRARGHGVWRLENEIAHFSSVYQGDFYKHRRNNFKGAKIAEIRTLTTDQAGMEGDETMEQQLLRRAQSFCPHPNENPFVFCRRVLSNMLPIKAPNFPARLRTIAARKNRGIVRMLALCAGEAAVEARLLAEAEVDVHLCLLDVHESMLEMAAKGMPPNVTVDPVLGDANRLGAQLGSFDVVVIVSGLHHLVELEKVLSTISRILNPGGEFWLIGEQVGRNGNRLWPDSRAEAAKIFLNWPPAKRLNHNTKKLDEELPDRDFSSACFEGIRSEEILDQIERYFIPQEMYLRDSFLWRLIDVSYAVNFDVEKEADRLLLTEMIAKEALHWASGGRSSDLHGVFLSKASQLKALLAEGEAGGIEPRSAISLN